MPVRIDPSVWAEEVERFAARSPARVAAQRERKQLEDVGISLSGLLRCDAAGTDGQVPVGVIGVEDDGSAQDRAVIFAAPGADPERDRYVFEHAGGRMTIAAVPDPAAAPATAVALVEQGAEHIAVCGGLGPVPAAAVIEVISDHVPVGAVMSGFESLPLVAAYRQRFEQALAAPDTR